MKSFYHSLQSEFYKSRKTLAFWSAILLPFIICGLVFIIFYIKSKDLASYANKENHYSLWVYFLEMILTPMGILILPMFIIFMSYSVNNTEHKGDMWKSLFSLPMPRWSIYYSKAFFALLLIFLCLFLFALFTFFGGELLGYLKPELGFQNINIIKLLFAIYFKLFIASLGILSLQFFMSLAWPDFLKPMGIGFILVIASLITIRWEYSYLNPYSQPALLARTIGDLQNSPLHLISKEIIFNLLMALISFPLGYYFISKKMV